MNRYRSLKHYPEVSVTYQARDGSMQEFRFPGEHDADMPIPDDPVKAVEMTAAVFLSLINQYASRRGDQGYLNEDSIPIGEPLSEAEDLLRGLPRNLAQYTERYLTE